MPTPLSQARRLYVPVDLRPNHAGGSLKIRRVRLVRTRSLSREQCNEVRFGERMAEVEPLANAAP